MSEIIGVIGGGPAGMVAAYSAAKRGKKVVVIEKNPMLGKKLLITGKGRCNITNSADTEEFIKNVPVNPSFLYSAFYTFTNDDIVSLLSLYGVETKVERGGRIFPQSDKSKDVRDALQRAIKDAGVKVCNGQVTQVQKSCDTFKIILSSNKSLTVDKVIVATGGMSYPLTGSTGDGYKFSKDFGHTVTDLKPSLVPLEIKEKEYLSLQGLSLKNIEITVLRNGKKIYTDFGEMLFTHFGVSGPVILSASSHIRDIKNDTIKINIDLKPALDEATLDKRILRDFEEAKNKDLINALDKLLPKMIIPHIIEKAKINPRKKVNEVTKEERRKLLESVKCFDVTVSDFRPLSEAIITSGGVSVKEINPSTMESKIVPGLYFAGEIIDVDAYTGGYNLQIAYSTGYLAGMNV